jgi:pimeloyl-ACP methyl ester carboxylesterase
MRRVAAALAWLGACLVSGPSPAAAAGMLAHDAVEGAAIDVVQVTAPGGGKTESVPFDDLGKARAPGSYTLRLSVSGARVRIPHCNGRGAVTLDGVVRDKGSKGPLLLALGDHAAHDLGVEVVVSAYEKRIACGERVRVGEPIRETEGLSLLRFPTPTAGPSAGEAVVFVPRRHDGTRPSALLVGLHPWNGGPWTYAAYRELLEQAEARDVVLLMPSGLGNSLYTAAAEDEVMRAIDALSAEVAVDRQRVSLWGASMGGQGATTIGFHRPDRFAFVASYFGDARFDLSTYVRRLLPTEEAARKVNALDVVDNARHVPTWLIHGEDDRTSPIAQSVMLFDAMTRRGFKVDLERVPGMGHEGPLVVRFLRRVVDRAAEARAPRFPARVSFRSVRGVDAEAYGVRLVRAGEGDAFVDLERREDGVHVLTGTSGVAQIVLSPEALGAGGPAPVHLAPGVLTSVRWAGNKP